MSENNGEHSIDKGEQPAMPSEDSETSAANVADAPAHAANEAAPATNAPVADGPQIPAAPTQAPQSANRPAESANPTPVAVNQVNQAPQYPEQQEHPTEQYPAAQDHPTEQYSSAHHYPTQQLPSPSTPTAPHAATGHAGPGYPASNAYPQTLAPAVTARPRDRKKVGMGMFTGGVLTAALVGGLVGGGSLYLLDQQNNNTVASSSSQSAPLVVNNTKSVNQVTAAAAKAMPSVVTISATSGSSGGTGSGIILDTEGHILTNTHVVTLDGAAAHATIQVQTSDNKVYDAKIVGTDPLSDLAVIKIDAPDLVPATLGDSNKINVGDTVIAIGSPLGLNATVTEGIISTLNRTIQVASSAVPETPSDSAPDQGGDGGFQFSPPGGGQGNSAATGTVNLNVIQTDAAINPGNSGGALVNAEGQIIGVNVAIASTGSSSDSSSQSGNIGVGFSIPIDHAKQVAQQIIKTGSATHGQLGVTVGGTSASGSSSSFSSGATVADVTAESAAAKAGLQKGDVVTQLGNRAISDPAELTAAVREQPGGATVKLDFIRDGKPQSVDVTLDTMPAS